MWGTDYGASATDRPLGTIHEEKGIFRILGFLTLGNMTLSVEKMIPISSEQKYAPGANGLIK